MLKKRVRVPRAHAPTVAIDPRRPIAQPGTTVPRAPHTASVQPARHGPTLTDPPAASAHRAPTTIGPSTTVQPPVTVPLVVSALIANDPPMVTVPLVAKDLTGSAHRVQLDLIQRGPIQTALDPTVRVPIALVLSAHQPIAPLATSVPLVSDLVAQLVHLMTAPVTLSAPRAR